MSTGHSASKGGDRQKKDGSWLSAQRGPRRRECQPSGTGTLGLWKGMFPPLSTRGAQHGFNAGIALFCKFCYSGGEGQSPVLGVLGQGPPSAALLACCMTRQATPSLWLSFLIRGRPSLSGRVTAMSVRALCREKAVNKT